MTQFVIKRILQMIPVLILVSIAVFTIINLPPGDYVSTLEAEFDAGGGAFSQRLLEQTRESFGLDRPIYVQYFYWVRGLLRGDLGISFELGLPVRSVIVQPLLLSVFISVLTLLFTIAVGIPIGVYSATHRYTVSDHVVTFLGFLGLSIPNFLLALTIVVTSVYVFDLGYIGGLFSREFTYAEWSLARFADMLKYIWVPVLVIGTAQVAEVIRIMRANFIDVMNQDYIITAKSKGLSNRTVTYKHALRVAVNPVVSIAGIQLPQTISGEIITAIVLGLPTLGPLLYRALVSQDLYLSGAIIMVLSVFMIVGSVVADIALGIVDPRIRYA